MPEPHILSPMNQVPEFDSYAVIKELAEVEQECLIPFAALRRLICTIQTGHFHRTVWYNPSTGKPCNEGWVPEPDARVACWEILQVIGLGRVRMATVEAVLRAAQAWVKGRPWRGLE